MKRIGIAVALLALLAGLPIQTGIAQTRYYTIHEYSYTIGEPIEATATLAPNTTIAPHLYNWYFDGVDDYLTFPDNTGVGADNTDYAVAVAVKPLDVKQKDIHFLTKLSLYFIPYPFSIILSPTSYYEVRIWNTTNVAKAKAQAILKVWSYLVGNYRRSDNIIEAWLNGTLKSTAADIQGDTDTSEPIYIGKGVAGSALHGYIAYAIIFNTPLTQNNIQDIMRGILNTKPNFLADPTFFNGTYYFDLVSGVVGTPYGGVARVPAEERWLWVVVGLRSDDKLHLEWFPAGSRVVFYNGSSIVASVTISGSANDAGLVEDYAVNVTATSVRAWIPARHVFSYNGSVVYSWEPIASNQSLIVFENMPRYTVVRIEMSNGTVVEDALWSDSDGDGIADAKTYYVDPDVEASIYIKVPVLVEEREEPSIPSIWRISVNCRAEESLAGVRLDLSGWPSAVSVFDPLGLCSLYSTPGNESYSIILQCINASYYYPFGLVVEAESILNTSIVSSDAVCTSLVSQGLGNISSQASRTLEQLARNMTSIDFVDYLVSLLPGKWTSIALLVEAFLFFATRSPAILAAAALVLSPLQPVWITSSILVASLGWLLYRLWASSGRD